MRVIAAIILLGFILAGCDVDGIYERNYEFESKFWHVDSIPSFEFEIPEGEQNYNVQVNVRNTLSYPYQNIYLTYFLEDSSGKVLDTDLVNFQLFDQKTGEPFGDGGLGDIYDHHFSLLSNYEFKNEGIYRLRLQHYMRRDSLPEILAVGVRIDQNNLNE